MKTLIIKSNSNSFEKYFSKRMNRPDVDVVDIEETKGLSEFSRKVVNKIPYISSLYTFWIPNWKKNIREYSTIIIFDYVLSLGLLRWIKTHNKKAKIKIWLWNIPTYDIEPFRKYGELYCFDRQYAYNHKINFIEQFYFPMYSDKNKVEKKGLIYVGYDKQRANKLVSLAKELQRQNILYDFILQKNPETKYSNEVVTSLTLHDRPLDYKEVIKKDLIYSTILELNIEEQKGLTLRTLEALFYKKKLITNNRNIKNFPFYNKNNIYILDNDERDFSTFLDVPYKDVSDDLLENYSYENWLKKIEE